MNVEELYKQLSYGELSNLAIAVEATGTIVPDQHPRVIRFANDALKRLYSRFVLSEKSELLMMVEGTASYTLQAQDVIRVLAVYTAYGHTLPFGDGKQPDVISNPSPNVLLVPIIQKDSSIHPGSQIEVIYQAKHPILVHDNFQQEIELPSVFEEAMMAYIGSQMYKGMGTPESMQTAAGHYARFQEICAEVEQSALASTGFLTTNTKFGGRGWV